MEKFNFDEETWDEFFQLAESYLDSLKTIEDNRVAALDSNKIALKDSAKIHSVLGEKN